MSFKRILFLFLAVFSVNTNCMPWAAIRQGAARLAAVTMGTGSLLRSFDREIVKLDISNSDNTLHKILQKEENLSDISNESAQEIAHIALKNGLDPENIYLKFEDDVCKYGALSLNGKFFLQLPREYRNSCLYEKIIIGAVEHEFGHMKNNDSMKRAFISRASTQIIFLTSILAKTNPLLKILSLIGCSFLNKRCLQLNQEQKADENITCIPETINFFEKLIYFEELVHQSRPRELQIVNKVFEPIKDYHPSTESRIIRLKERLWGKDHPEEYAKLMEQREQEDNARKMLL